MRRSDRLLELMTRLRDGRIHRAEDLAARFGVSVRTIYRDMDTLAASGIPVEGTRGSGYRALDTLTLPPLSLTPAEIEALQLGLAIVAEAPDPDLKAAALSLTEKMDAALPSEAPTDRDAALAVYPFSDAARGFSHMSTIRAAIRGRQKLRLSYRRPDDVWSFRTIRPLQIDHFGRVWSLTAWCELRNDFRVFRLDLIESADILPELFVDEPGKSLADYRAAG
ncbi:helix-turn-helix transcriptional regulator [Marinibacterium profundimaris]|uniref:Transcriptional regulator n=1 Tax=Marinibacterium profundimaris TaxID=1679460 RepID=A0A225P0Y6_9RHOB|nr:YafY family protein [Marinibacterium profundimaris]OWU77876.1 transcriptional regulator [Marinibacterium profundimaris]